MHEVLVNRLGGLSLPRKSVVRLTDRPDMTLDVYRGRKTTMQQQQIPPPPPPPAISDHRQLALVKTQTKDKLPHNVGQLTQKDILPHIKIYHDPTPICVPDVHILRLYAIIYIFYFLRNGTGFRVSLG